MKNLLLYFGLSISLIIASCSSNEDSSKEQQLVNSILILKNTNGGSVGINENFNAGAVIWSFNEYTHILSISKKVNTIGSGIPAGTYSYELKTEDTSYILEIKQSNSVFTRLIVDFLGEDILVIKDEAVADGFQYTFTKNCDEEIFCTLEAIAGLDIQVKLGDSTSSTTEGISVVATSGSYSETLQPFPDNTDPNFVGAYEKAATYIITVSKSGYKTYRSTPITLSSDCCHVIPQTLNVVLQPN